MCCMITSILHTYVPHSTSIIPALPYPLQRKVLGSNIGRVIPSRSNALDDLDLLTGDEMRAPGVAKTRDLNTDDDGHTGLVSEDVESTR